MKVAYDGIILLSIGFEEILGLGCRSRPWSLGL
jgi:hypothetical protein